MMRQTSKTKILAQESKDTRWYTVLVAGLVTTALVISMLVSWSPASAASVTAQRGAPDSFADLVEKLQPAVVSIRTTQTVFGNRRGNRVFPQLPEGAPGQEFFEEFQRRRQQEGEEEPRQAMGQGSGFIISREGLIVTNHHVINGAEEITVRLFDEREFDAVVVGQDQRSDLALLKIEDSDNLPFVEFGDSDASRIGDWVIAIGNPFALGGSVTAGIVSARGRELGGTQVDYEMIQTDASINRGNSGGPTFNMQGEVIGVNTAIFSPTGGNVGIGFAIPSNYASHVIEQFKEHGRAIRGYLGVTIRSLDEDMVEIMGLDSDEGAIVSTVQPDSPADKSGIEVSDIILLWDNQKVNNSRELSKVVARTPVGKAVKVIVLRNGERQTLDVTTGELELAEEDAPAVPRAPRDPRPTYSTVEGMALAPMTGEMRRGFRIDEETDGVVVTRVERGSNAFRAGLRSGAVIMRVNGQTVEEPEEVLEAIEAAREEGKPGVLLLVSLRGGNVVHLPLRLSDDE